MESQPQNPEFRNYPENVHLCKQLKVTITVLRKLRECSGSVVECLTQD